MVKLGPLKEYQFLGSEKSCVFLSDFLSPKKERIGLFVKDYYINVEEHWLGDTPKYRGFFLCPAKFNEQRTITYEQRCSWED